MVFFISKKYQFLVFIRSTVYSINKRVKCGLLIYAGVHCSLVKRHTYVVANWFCRLVKITQAVSMKKSASQEFRIAWRSESETQLRGSRSTRMLIYGNVLPMKIRNAVHLSRRIRPSPRGERQYRVGFLGKLENLISHLG